MSVAAPDLATEFITEQKKITAEVRELDLLVESTLTEVSRLKAREDQTKAKVEEHRLLTPEYAYLTDLKHHRADSEWKAVRKAKAKSALKTLARVAPV